ncbi:glycosyltransferase [Paraglaciecola aquimarina]|uniref:Glycosyltransferase n=1 Tax=Paraglaciecola aquimarina TaxID=1235557 RepID=A0ABU3T0C9_9ALTE|nr:glycosyltransferase [Paraglaciecola aquimarina]MDU0355708.1 glycosyltransferase [Paraglaciecola aquimarina]
MRIALISKASRLGGGGSQVATNLANLLRQSGHFCHHFRRDKEYGYDANESSIYGKYESKIKYIDHRLRKLGGQELLPWEYLHLKSEMFRLNIDVIHVHDTTTAISPITIGMLSKYFPVVWTMHDFSPFTGGCINSLGCERFKLQCGKCPQRDEWPIAGKFDFTSLQLHLKKRLFKENVSYIAPSTFIKNMAVSAGIDKNKVAVIHNSVDIKTFYPKSKVESRTRLGLDPAKFTILLLAYSINDRFKGMDDAIRILQDVDADFQVLVVGKISEKDKALFKGVECFFTGFVQDPDKLNVCYNSANIFLNCSKADNFPLVVLQSLAAGTPVYGYATGGIVEMITNGSQGILVKTGDWQELKVKMLEFMQSIKIADSGTLFSSCRDIVSQLFTDKLFLNETVRHYRQVITKWRAEK